MAFFDNRPTSNARRLQTGDDNFEEFNLGFPFTFYGVTYQSVFVNQNGNLTFNVGSSDFTPTPEEFRDGPPRIAPYWIDLDPRCSPSQPIKGAFVKSLPDRFIVTYLNNPYFNCNNQNPIHPPINTFQVVLFRSGLIGFAYRSVDNRLPAGDAGPEFPLVGVASGSGGLSNTLQYPSGSLRVINSNTVLIYQFNGNNYDLTQLPPNCNANDFMLFQTRLTSALNTIRPSVNASNGTVCGLRGLTELSRCLDNSLRGIRPLYFRFGCNDVLVQRDLKNPVCSDTVTVVTCVNADFTCIGTRVITICGFDRFTSSTGTFNQNRFNAVVFHELIHACGGTELDAEAFENHCFRGRGATPPDKSDRDNMRKLVFRPFGSRGVRIGGSLFMEGEFVLLNIATGEVFVKRIVNGEIRLGDKLNVNINIKTET